MLYVVHRGAGANARVDDNTLLVLRLIAHNLLERVLEVLYISKISGEIHSDYWSTGSPFHDDLCDICHT